MYFPTFFPSVPRPFDARPLGPMDMPAVLTGREREIPLDLSIKTVRQPGDPSPEDYLLLDQRKFLGLGRPGNFLDTSALFRLPYRVDMPYPFCAGAVSHPAAVMSGLMQQQRERCMEPICPRTTHPVSPFMDPATLSLHFRNGGAMAPQARATTNAGPSFYSPLIVPTSAGSYPLFSDFLQSTNDRRVAENASKGAFTSIHQRNPEKSSVPSCPTSSASSFLQASSAAVAGLEARYAEHFQRLRDAKCTAACCLQVTHLTQSTAPSMSSCGCCVGGSPCRKETKGASNGYLVAPAAARPPVSSAAPDLRIPPFCSLPEMTSLFAPTSVASTGVWSPATKIAAVASPVQKRKEGVAQKESPRAARDFPAPPVGTTSDSKPSHHAKIFTHRDPDVIIIEEKNRTPFSFEKDRHKRATVDPSVEIPPAKMPRLEAASSTRSEVEPWSPAGPPPLLPAVIPDIGCRPLFGEVPYLPDPASAFGKLAMRLPKKLPSGIPFELPSPVAPFVAKSELVLPSSETSFKAVASASPAEVPTASSPVETKIEPTVTLISNEPSPPPNIFFPVARVVSSPSKETSFGTPEEDVEEAKRQRALKLYSDLSEIDQQDKDGQKSIRLREPNLDAQDNTLRVIKPEDIQIKTECKLQGGGASAVEESLRQEALRLADVRAKKRLRRRILARLYSEKTAGNSDDDTESPDEEEEEEVEGVDKSPAEKQPLERRLMSQMNLTWRQRRLLYSCRRRRFRSGLDMINRRPHRKRPKQATSTADLPPEVVAKMDAEQQRRLLAAEESLAKASSEGGVPPEMKRLMVNKALGETILHRAARQCYLEVVLYCLETKCCDVNARDNAGYTPLHECCSRGHLQVARALLQHGADLNASAAGGIRPLHDAVENDHVECVRLLLSYGADPTIATYSGLSPLKLARSPIMTEFLRGFMSDISGDNDGHPVLPWQFQGSASCLDPPEWGFDLVEGVPSDEEAASAAEGEGEEGNFLFEVSDSPLLPSFRLYLPPTATGANKAPCNCLRLSDVLKQTGLTKEEFRRHYSHLDLVTVPRHEFEAGAACSQLLTGTRLDTLLATAATDEDPAYIDVLRLDSQLRQLLGIETITLR